VEHIPEDYMEALKHARQITNWRILLWYDNCTIIGCVIALVDQLVDWGAGQNV
jgi:hypothetical protein